MTKGKITVEQRQEVERIIRVCIQDLVLSKTPQNIQRRHEVATMGAVAIGEFLSGERTANVWPLESGS